MSLLKPLNAGLWCAVIALVGLFVPFWHYTDTWILTDVLGYARQEAIDPHIVAIDLGAPAGRLRAPLIALLEGICRPARPYVRGGTLACTRRHLSLPAAIVMDIEFFEGSGDASLVDRLRADILALRQDGVGVYCVLSPDAPDLQPVKRIYDALTGYGHTHISVVPYFSTGFAWYFQHETIYGQTVPALPLAVKPIEGASDLASGNATIIPIGPNASFLQNSSSPAAVIASLAGDSRLDSTTQPGEFADDTFVVGNAANDVQLPGGRTGFEIVVWAISDWFTDPRASRRLQTGPDTLLMLLLTVAASFAAAAAFGNVFQRVKTKRLGYAIAFAAGCGAAGLGVALVVGVALLRDYAFAQVSLVAVGIVTATFLAARDGALAVKHDRYLAKLSAEAACGPEDRFDIFISYSHDPENAKWVEENVYAPLSRATDPEGRPLRIFFDRDSITAGSDWYERIVRSIEGSKRFVPVYSRDYFRRWFCHDELELALFRRSRDPKFVLPVTRIGYKLPRRYASIQALDSNSPLFAEDLLRMLLPQANAPHS